MEGDWGASSEYKEPETKARRKRAKPLGKYLPGERVGRERLDGHD